MAMSVSKGCLLVWVFTGFVSAALDATNIRCRDSRSGCGYSYYNGNKCYECESHTNPGCGDPFNRTAMHGMNHSISTCYGLCIKWTRFNDSMSSPNIIRTCSTNISIRLFYLTGTCLSEKGGYGSLCFCEDLYKPCNRSPPLDTSILLYLFVIYGLVSFVTLGSYKRGA